MLRIGENLNVMVKKIGAAMKDRDPKPIQELAIAEAKAGVDYIDINLGPARKGGGELMEWIVKIVQEVVDTPLYLDTINAEAIEAGLKVYKNKKGKAVINSIMARPESMDAKFPIAQKYDAGSGCSSLGSLRTSPGCRRERGPGRGIDAKRRSNSASQAKMSGWIRSSPL